MYYSFTDCHDLSIDIFLCVCVHVCTCELVPVRVSGLWAHAHNMGMLVRGQPVGVSSLFHQVSSQDQAQAAGLGIITILASAVFPVG